MASISDILLSLFKGAGASPEEAQAKVDQYASHPDAASVLSPFDVQTSDSTATQNGNIPAPATPPPVQLGLSDMATPATSDLSQIPVAPPAAAPAPTPAPAAPAATPPVAPPVAAAAKPATPPPAAPADNAPSADQALRDKALADALHRRHMAGIGGAVAGVGDAVGGALAGLGVKTDTGAQERVLNRAKTNYDESKGTVEAQISNDPNSDASKSARQLVLQIAPQMANQPGFAQMTDQELRDKLPLVDTMMKAKAAEDAKKASLAQTQAMRDMTLGEKNSQFEDRQVNQGLTRVATVRGDQSLARVENQRDAASSAYTLLQTAKNEGRPLTQPEYYDLLGQLWKARSGATPSNEAMRDLDAKTLHGDLNKAVTYFTGKPAGATTQAALNNLQQFVQHTGQLADTQHDAYMAPHLIKPAGVSDQAWDRVAKTGRGQSFADAKKAADGSLASSTNAGPARQTSGGYSYTVSQ